MLTPPTSPPTVSVDDAYQATESERSVSGYFEGVASFEVVLETYGNDAGEPGRPALLVYDFIINGAACVPSEPTTAPPEAPPPLTTCTVHVLVDAKVGTLLLKTELWS